ncbi:MAG: hypothetical protein ACLFWF_00805 [Alphaproteobacteria bacterium]
MAVHLVQTRASADIRNRWRRVCGAPVLAAALCAGASPALAQETGAHGTDPYQDEWSDEGDTMTAPEEGAEAPAEEEMPEEEPGVPPEEEYDHRTGAEARRELLFREGVEEREYRNLRGLEPSAPVARTTPDVYDARERGRNAQVLSGIRPGLTVDSTVSTGIFVDSNPQLLSSEEAFGQDRGAWGWFVEPSVAVARSTPRTLLQGVLSLPYDDFNSFDNDLNDDLGSFDQYAGLQYDLFGRETAINVFTNIANSTRRTALVEETGGDLSGDRVLTYGGGGSFKYTLTPDTVMQFSASARRQDLEDTGDEGIITDPDEDTDLDGFVELDDSTFYQLALDFRRLVTATDTVGLGGSYEQFLPDGGFNPDVTILTALASWSRDVSSSMNFLLEGGAQIISSDNDFAESETSVSPFAQATFYWGVTNRDSFLFSFGHSAEPTGAGQVRNTNRLEVEYQRALTRRLALGVPLLGVFQDEALAEDSGNRLFFQFAPRLVWAITPEWGLSFEYRLRVEDDENVSTTTSNAAFLSLSYFGRLVP